MTKRKEIKEQTTIYKTLHRNLRIEQWWVESDFKAPNLPLSLRLKVSGCHYNIIYKKISPRFLTSGNTFLFLSTFLGLLRA
jgi:hypothetical protein